MAQARVLVIAGSDSGGGAGIQADIKTITALGGYAATAITALTAQNTEGVQGIHPVPPEFVASQMEAVLQDIGADVLKTGMLHDAAVIEVVSEQIRRYAADIPLVVDPVMVSQSGSRLLRQSALTALRERLLPQALLMTPNVPEAETFLDRRITTVSHMQAAARRLQREFGCSILLKGGHLPAPELVDVLVTPDGEQLFEGEWLTTKHNHGTGCTLASAIAVSVGQGLPLEVAVARARAYVRKALETAPGLGRGCGPVNHGHTVKDTLSDFLTPSPPSPNDD
ncbi:bifunctional hydroxymethylpyrimidine kinase/phosphomethylpyrimidine kinase [Alkalilimnicola ehrlichii]|uniref:hydroxymethylpyrimidine kinase n=1 Tax=Alkalilimnicola ehrlichii TaxID=351052 RepID=A0A3E0WFD4_9GAMM|nr:bifunctional hydroxymethylpyrimidine kinase/phosphomethylpyrimidine kinase [Alkalilimnicola ehrlichii]RFA28304.1 bifunctional hydroxymethylpyrimidine kinase/phosphomethylpyrimidine kinase [Alkalilimnicola ehrlichii]RFA31654.1 bifunctional hydroxymethylpyrimidine kinase/phosphomethylpyrimidine kinase [Alkalilimnicola ehrlichii]